MIHRLLNRLAASLLGGGLRLVAHERLRQEIVDGWTDKYNDAQVGGQLARAAACYSTLGTTGRVYDEWPFGDYLFDERTGDGRGNLRQPTNDERIVMLAKAGAFIVAEIERVQRRKKFGLDKEARSWNSRAKV